MGNKASSVKRPEDTKPTLETAPHNALHGTWSLDSFSLHPPETLTKTLHGHTLDHVPGIKSSAFLGKIKD